jgi:hypothetical protein
MWATVGKIPSPPRDTLRCLIFRQGVAEIKNSKVQATQGLDMFGS